MSSQFMPRVTAGVCDAITKEIREGALQYVERKLLEIAKENPHVANFISLHARASSAPIPVSVCGVIVYELIRQQMEADTMDKSFGT